MSVQKVYQCDLCGQARERASLMRLGVRTLDDRPEDAEIVDVCTVCYDRPVGDAIAIGKAVREVHASGQQTA